MIKDIICLSGGLDSTTVLAEVIEKRDDDTGVLAVSFNYGSKHNPYEIAAAHHIAEHYDVYHKILDLTPIFSHMQSNLLLSGGAIPEGHYEAESMRRTVVPGRNTIFASILLGIAQSVSAKRIWLGIHAGDHQIYADCRPRWAGYMRGAIDVASEQKVYLRTPFLLLTKKDIIKRGLALEVPYELTRTCYKSQEIACGRCGSCQERLTAFKDLNSTDPLPYESREILPR